MKQPIRVLMLAKGLGRGGTERLLAGGLRHADHDRFDFEVAYVLPWKDALVDDIENLGVDVHCLRGGGALRMGWIPRLRRLVRERRYDIVHTHMPQPALAARLALGASTPIIVHTEHNVWRRYRRLTRWSNSLTYGRNAAVIAVSHGVADSIRPPRVVTAPPVEVLIHGVDATATPRGDDARRDAREVLGLDQEGSVVGTVGNFTAKKDQRVLLHAVSALAPMHPSLRLVMVGSGPLENELRDLARRLHIAERVLFAGSRDDVPEILPAFDVFALSSRHEGLSIALLEAMAAGVPCVATKVGGIPEILSDGKQGLLVKARNPAALGAAIGSLLNDPAERARMSEHAVQQAARYEISSAMTRIQDVYECLVS